MLNPSFQTTPAPPNAFLREVLFFGFLLIAGGLLAYYDHQMELGTILLEYVHATVLTILFAACVMAQIRYPEVTRFGWSQIFLGLLLLTIAGWTDILDNYDVTLLGIPFGHSWQQAFIEKILGYTVGISLIAVGFSRWIPWMVKTRRRVETLNRELTYLITSFDERVEAERLSISRELHDDVAQQLTFMTFQTQILETQLNQPKELKKSLQKFSADASETLKTVRRISQNLRPESLFSLGFKDALQQFIGKQRVQAPAFTITYAEAPHTNGITKRRLEEYFNEERLLHVFRLVQESIRNAIKHSGGSDIQIIFNETNSQYSFTIIDNGDGLPWDEAPNNDILVEQGHLGVAGMRERAEALNGSYTLKNRYNNKQQVIGSQVEVVLPK